MKGAEDLDPEMIEGRILINIDSDQEGKFFVSCAGGPAAITSIPLIWEKANANMAAYAIKIRGLLGGHSGSDIDKGRANSNKLMGRILKELETKFEFSMASLSGGMMYNAIPREANAVILIRPEARTAVSESIAEMVGVFRNEYRISDPDIEVVFEADSESATKVFSQYAKALAINYLYLAETGINTMSGSIPGLVESSISLGVVRTAPCSVDFTSLIRSSVNTLHKELLRRLETLAEFTGADVRILSDCPLWEYNPDSKIRKLFERVYSRLYNMEAEAAAIHVGLECGIFDEKFNGEMDMISFGPDVYEYHTPDEHYSISSAERSFDFLSEVLKEIE
jgi:dipeptidase D